AAALLTAILTIPLRALHLTLGAYQLVLPPHWRPVWTAFAAVFLFQLFKSWLMRAQAVVTLPAAPTMAAPQQRAIIWVLRAVGLVWPLFGGRGAVGVATPALRYVILRLGLNTAAGLAALHDLVSAGFYAVGGSSPPMPAQASVRA
ncbi:DUF3382 domain-containing protein, partial [Burkholderia cenocepacia]|uniref:DUF3382 domain-containing protein n=1 Tax=Burkholderia cenocepacia TaxID=95486 RepID=UPI00406C04C6